MLIRLISTATKRNDLVVAAAIVMVVFMMIIPLPTSLVDILIAINMSVASILLMVSLYLPSPLAFSSFPSVLLITTLFRLGISIATTRLILLNGDAGHIIYTFGFFVVGGNLVVGLVVFLILTVVQFIVITKGAERVSEVAARFSLDAMPGKQMSIDGDMRAGAINMEEAKRRRFLVEKESQLYGAMDGAMKFVKGDAIAGLIIVAVNLIGGIIIGMLQKDMTAGDAMRAYSVLSIGDGLISQIPALFISICAGMIVTRVSSVDGGPSNVGKDIGEQIFAQPRALIIGSAIMLGLGFVPGMPTTVFFFIATVIGILGYVLLTRRDEIIKAQKSIEQKDAEKAAGAAGAADSKAEDDREFAPTVPLILEVSKDLDQTFSTTVLNDELIKIRRALYLDLGVPFPGIQLRYTDRLPEETYVIQLNEVPISQGNLKPRHVLVRENKKTLQTLNIDFIEGESFLGGIATIWVREELEPTLTQANITCMRITQILTYHLATILKKYATDFLGIQESKALLTSMEAKFPDLIKEIMRVMPIQKIAEILQRLVSEDISIRNIRTVVEALIEWGQKEKDSVLLTEYVRTALKRQISHKFAQEKNSLPAYLFSPTVEDMVRNAIRQTSAGSYLALDPQSSKRLVANIKKTIGDVQSVAKKPVLLTSMDIRRYIRKLIEQDMYEIPVLSYQELTQDVTVQPLGRVEM
ncbi:type III secretion system export apparatus subunit SctV [Candidatus Ichthyocystis hellenicum]|uniref:type III secretion system export apparatus subunit SctV n=1 Tax=Candidatus Ichthyocystis hellenicum TaxID=1561003 RepID=UPI002417A43C|nr:type III secretion system export apparatus subunit SctV [Candidatus Ichthyocystis hellenicum]